jgi:hypothetical protein
VLAPRGIRRILLVTSAMHMPRATGTFRKAGFEVIAGRATSTLGGMNRMSWPDGYPAPTTCATPPPSMSGWALPSTAYGGGCETARHAGSPGAAYSD